MDPVVHFEIPADNVVRAQDFYNRAFGWKMHPVSGMDYTIVHTAPTDDNRMIKEPGKINGGIMKRFPPIMRPVITISVEEIQRALQKVKSAGGKTIKEPITVGDMGIAAYVQDTEGNIIGLWQPLKKH
jgi:predicted enzyme related to lactoylglutathione lyase